MLRGAAVGACRYVSASQQQPLTRGDNNNDNVNCSLQRFAMLQQRVRALLVAVVQDTRRSTTAHAAETHAERQW